MKNDASNPKHSEESEISENPITYYLNHIGNQEIMNKLKWEDPLLYFRVQRISYILSFKSKEPLWKCPHCGEQITEDEWGEEYCPSCGLVTRSNYPYVAGIQFELPYGVKL